jgi:hypothetical protein
MAVRKVNWGCLTIVLLFAGVVMLALTLHDNRPPEPKAIITAADIADGFSPDADIKPEDKETAKLIRLVVLNQGYSCNQVYTAS